MILGAAPSIAGSSSTPSVRRPFSSPAAFRRLPHDPRGRGAHRPRVIVQQRVRGVASAGSPPRLAYTRSFFSTSVTTHFLFLLSGRGGGLDPVADAALVQLVVRLRRRRTRGGGERGR